MKSIKKKKQSIRKGDLVRICSIDFHNGVSQIPRAWRFMTPAEIKEQEADIRKNPWDSAFEPRYPSLYTTDALSLGDFAIVTSGRITISIYGTKNLCEILHTKNGNTYFINRMHLEKVEE